MGIMAATVSVLLASMPAASEARALAWRACPAPATALQCATLDVPEDWSKPDGRMLALDVVKVPAVKPDPKRAPLVDLQGGPGLAATPGADFYLTMGALHRQDRDVILMDQRGTHGSHALRCPGLSKADPLDGSFPVALVKACRDTLAKDHDLSKYGTDDAAQDLEALRRALGVEQLDLSGISYGTRLAQAYLRRHPDRVRAALLIGTVPDDARIPLHYARFGQDVFDAVLADCAADAACAKENPDLAETWRQVLAKADAGEIRVDRNGTKKALTRAALVEAVRNRMISASAQRALPALVTSLGRGEFDAFAAKLVPDDTYAIGLYLSVLCPEDTLVIGESDIVDATAGTQFGRSRVDAQVAACKAWGLPPRALSYPAFPDVPVLLLAGTRDHVTPPSWAKQVAAGMPRAQLVEIPGLGHFPEGLPHMECYDAMIAAFFAEPAKPVDAACVATMK